jgi:hypothetical protein
MSMLLGKRLLRVKVIQPRYALVLLANPFSPHATRALCFLAGGQAKAGEGWRMFVECLAEGRGVSLPAGSVGAGRGVVSGVGAYSRVRKQFRVPIAEFGGIQEGA